MDVLFRIEEGSVADVLERLPDSPDYHSIRVTLARMEKEGYVRHREEGQRYIYEPVMAREEARKTAVHHLLNTFFSGSPSRAILSILDEAPAELSREELDEIARIFDKYGREDL